MASRLKRTFMALLVMTVMFGMISCSAPQAGNIPINDQNPTATPETEPDDKDNINKIINNGSDSEGESFTRITVTYYSVNTKSLKLVQSVSVVRSGDTLDPMTILSLVEDSFEDSSVNVTFDGAYFDQNGYCVVEINDSIKDISKESPALETLILDACGQSILDNIDAPGVIIRLGENAYVTDQYNFDIDHVYMDM